MSAARNVVVAAVSRDIGLGTGAVTNQSNDIVTPNRTPHGFDARFQVSARVEARRAAGEIVAGVRTGGRIDLRAAEGLEARAVKVVEMGPAIEQCVVAEDQVGTRAAIDRIVARTADQDVLTAVAVDDVGDAILGFQRLHQPCA